MVKAVVAGTGGDDAVGSAESTDAAVDSGDGTCSDEASYSWPPLEFPDTDEEGGEEETGNAIVDTVLLPMCPHRVNRNTCEGIVCVLDREALASTAWHSDTAEMDMGWLDRQ